MIFVISIETLLIALRNTWAGGADSVMAPEKISIEQKKYHRPAAQLAMQQFHSKLANTSTLPLIIKIIVKRWDRFRETTYCKKRYFVSLNQITYEDPSFLRSGNCMFPDFLQFIFSK
jgi:hypothetical protein